MKSAPPADLLRDPQALFLLAADRLYPTSNPARPSPDELAASSAVLLLLDEHSGQLRLVLNKRSRDVRQAGDLCLPGGGLSPRLDAALSRLLRLPNAPLRTWPCFDRWVADGSNGMVPLLLAGALREGFEEMRLDPFNPMLLGLLPPQGLRVMRGAIYPVVARLRRPQEFKPNWEVERVVVLPLAELLDRSRHLRLKVTAEGVETPLQGGLKQDFGCVEIGADVLWGLTYRIIEVFLEQVLQFRLPAMKSRRLRELTLDAGYFSRPVTR